MRLLFHTLQLFLRCKTWRERENPDSSPASCSTRRSHCTDTGWGAGQPRPTPACPALPCSSPVLSNPSPGISERNLPWREGALGGAGGEGAMRCTPLHSVHTLT